MKNKKIFTKLLAGLMLLITMSTILSTSAFALSSTWNVKAVEKLSQTDAQIKARVTFPKKVTCTQGGFYIGTSKDNLTKNAKYDKVNYTNNYIDMSFLMSKYGQKLKSGTTYYYKFYVIAGGKTYYSPVNSFKTVSELSASWDVKTVEKLSQTDAQIKARANFSKEVKCTEAGFYFGTSKNNLTKNSKYDTINYTGKYLDMWFLMSKYGQSLKAGTTYYYKFYVVAGGKTYYSPVNSFKTVSELSTSWDVKTVEKLSQTDAQIKARVTFPKKATCTQGGFYIGTSKDNLTKNAKYDKVNYTNNYIDMSFLMSKYGQTLKSGTTYYYKFYVIAGGKTYYSPVNSFKTVPDTTTTTTTPKLEASWTVGTKNITNKNAKIYLYVNVSYSADFTESGFYIGTKKDNLVKHTYLFDKSLKDTKYTQEFDLSKYGLTLNFGTTYYYKTYVVVNGQTFYSNIYSFKTTNEIESTATSQVSYVFTVSSSNVDYKHAKITSKVTFRKKTNVTERGFYIGTKKNTLNKCYSEKIKDSDGSVSFSYEVSKYTTLKPNTTYYYQTYVVYDNKRIYSAEKSFKTAKLTVLTWPVKDSTGISQGFHKGCIDITGADKVVVAAMGGTVYKKYTCTKNHYSSGKYGDCGGFGTGLIIKGDDGRYYQYAHMKGKSIPSSIKVGSYVKQGATIGKVGNTGYSNGAHLHFGISKSSNLSTKKYWVDPMNETYNNKTVSYFKKVSASDITKKDAKITATTVKTKYDSFGFYIGTSKTSMKKYTEKSSSLVDTIFYKMNKWHGKLKTNTKYYYKFYVVVNGKTYYSDIKSFTTKK